MTETPKAPVSARRIWPARGIAVAADFAQIAVFPLFSEGILSPLNVALDILVCGLLIVLVEWHIAFLLTFIIEQLTFADLAPTWTLAALLRGKDQNFTKLSGQT